MGNNIGNWKPVLLKQQRKPPTSAAGVVGTSAGTIVAEPRTIALQWADSVEGPDLSPLGGMGRVVATCCCLCQGRLVTLVSVYMWYTECWSPRNIRLAQKVSWYLRSLRDGLWSWKGFQPVSSRLLVTRSRLRLPGRSDPPKGGHMQERRSLVRVRLHRGEPRHGPVD